MVAYHDKNRARAEEMAAQYGGVVCDSYFDLLNRDDVDAVSICVENRSHAEISTAALYAGKHVLCEKPMAVTLAECESMVAAAERNGRHLMVGHNMRFDPVHRRAKQLLDSGVIGDVITFRAVLGNAGPEGWSVDEGTWFFDKNKAALGALSDMGIHKVDLIQYLLGQKVIETTAKVVTLNKRDSEGNLIGVDDNALCILRMSGGALGTMAASWTIYGNECQSTCLYGTKGHHADLQRGFCPPHHGQRSGGATPPATTLMCPTTAPASSTSSWTHWSTTASRRSPDGRR